MAYAMLYLSSSFLYVFKINKIRWFDVFVFPILDFLRLGALFLGDLYFSLINYVKAYKKI
jgi:hypothetical protein